jgi:shikimate 5-dehydrogenase
MAAHITPLGNIPLDCERNLIYNSTLYTQEGHNIRAYNVSSGVNYAALAANSYVGELVFSDLPTNIHAVNQTLYIVSHTSVSTIDISDKLHPALLVYDLIYNPCETKLLKMAKKRGARVSNGLGMLLYQGARSFEIWTGKKAPVETMRRALKEGVRKL